MSSTGFYHTFLIFGLFVWEVCAIAPARWQIGQYSKCTATCGRGVQSRSVLCTDIFRNSPAPESLCPPPKPSATRSCSIVSCAPGWTTGKWRECSKTCGRGVQHRDIRCEQRLADGTVTTVSNDYCPRNKPSTKKRCSSVDCPPRYTVKKWTECSSSCGSGIQIRPVQCSRIRAGSHSPEYVSRSYCSHLVSPITKRRCNMQKCSGSTPPYQSLEGGVDPSRSYYRRRRLHRTRSLVGKISRNEHFRRRLRLPYKKRFDNDITMGRRISRRRSITTVEKGRVYRCGGNARNPAFANGENPCDPSADSSNPSQNTEKLTLRRGKYTMPFIVTQNDVSPVQIAGDIVTYVGGRLTVSNTQTVTILCESSGYPPPTTEWYKDGVRLMEDDRHILLPDHSLRLINPFREDGGNYTCIARNTIGKTSASTAVSVATKPRIISTVERSDHFDSATVDARIGAIIRASPGSLVRISCPVEGFPPPRIRWNKDIAGLGDNVRILPDNSLEIDIATSLDQGLYNCEATNPIGTDYRTSTLLLFETPRLQEFLTSLDIPDGISRGLPRLLLASNPRPSYKIDNRASALLGCPVTIQGPSRIYWTYQNRPLHQYSHELRFQILIDGKVLFLESVSEDSTGIYSCHVSNEAGNVTGSLEIGLAYYEWIPGKMTACSHTCGGSGFQHLPVNCVREGTEMVPDAHCDELTKPRELKIPCNRVDCPARFHVGTWGFCSKTCGTGEKRRQVSCLVQKSDNDLKLVSSTACLNSENPDTLTNAVEPRKPAAVESCLLQACPRWSSGSWSQCGDKCYGLGMSIKVRRVTCLNANGTAVSRMECPPADRPKWRDLCFTWRCEPIWAVSKWSSCSRSCGDDGIQTRILSCVFRGNKWQRAGNLCETSLRPPVSTSCNRHPCDGG